MKGKNCGCGHMRSGGAVCHKCGGKTMGFGGAVAGMKKYRPGGQVEDDTKKTKDKELFITEQGNNSTDPSFDADALFGNKPMMIKDSQIEVSEEPTATRSTGYKEEIAKEQAKGDDRSMPNWGRAKKEQMRLNELIRKDIAAGKKAELLKEDDVIGDKTLAAMNAYEGKGYTRPELFKDKWLAEYKKNAAAGIGIGGGKVSGVGKIPGVTTDLKPIVPKIENLIEKPGNPKDIDMSFAGSIENQMEYFSKNNKGTKNQGWVEDYLLKNKGVKIKTSDLKGLDADSWLAIPGVNKKNIRLGSPEKDSKNFPDAAEKSQYWVDEMTGKKYNTSLAARDEIMSKHEDAIIIHNGTDPYDRDIYQIYVKDGKGKYHAYDSLLAVDHQQLIYGKNKFGVGLTEREEGITKTMDERGGFPYPQSPYNFRKSFEFGGEDPNIIRTAPIKTEVNKPETKTEVKQNQYGLMDDINSAISFAAPYLKSGKKGIDSVFDFIGKGFNNTIDQLKNIQEKEKRTVRVPELKENLYDKGVEFINNAGSFLSEKYEPIKNALTNEYEKNVKIKEKGDSDYQKEFEKKYPEESRYNKVKESKSKIVNELNFLQDVATILGRSTTGFPESGYSKVERVDPRVWFYIENEWIKAKYEAKAAGKNIKDSEVIDELKRKVSNKQKELNAKEWAFKQQIMDFEDKKSK